ncbi:MAG TPA: hypothetical protein VFK78_09740 [Gemmatimonadales bacterium]|nr:hypothetical protein [Gemmatimonadales bacterium]
MRAPLVAAALAAGALVAACTQDVSAPGSCPAFCPAHGVTLVDTVLPLVQRDSSFRGYVQPYEASQLLAATLPSVDSRPIFVLNGFPPRRLVGTDTTTGLITGVDSLVMRLFIERRDTAAHNLTLRLYRMPKTIDSTTGFADVAAAFTDSLFHSINVDSVYALAGHIDPATGDSVSIDSTSQLTTVVIKLDSASVPYDSADSGRTAMGLRVFADSAASIALGAVESGLGPQLSWFIKLDSLGTTIHAAVGVVRLAEFDGFVLNPPAPADTGLVVGGVPSARSILRIPLPRGIRDSSQILRATLLLIPRGPVSGVASDSFLLSAHAVEADFGAKSPIATDSTRTATVEVHTGVTDTVRIELTRMLRFWAIDTLAPPALVLRQFPEGGRLAGIAFHASGDSAFRPLVHITYAPRYPFGVP